MEMQTEKIKRFSRIICILLTIAYIALIVVAIMQLLAWILTTANLHTELVTIDGVEMEAPVLFKIGETNVVMPVVWESGYDISGVPLLQGFASTIGISDFLATVFSLIGIRFAKKVFVLLRENGSPFRKDVVKSLKKLAIVLLVVGFVSGVISFLAAGIVWVLYLIFDYGRMLQDESDTTL